MMTTYCPHCGKPNHYQTQKPTKCEGCGKQMTQAFAAVVPQVQVTQSQRVIKPREPFRGSNPLPQRDGEASHASQDDGYEGDEHVDKSEVAYRAQILASQIRVSDFMVSTESNIVKMSDLIKQGQQNGR